MQDPLTALIATHSSDLTNKIAARRYKSKGYERRILGMPSYSEKCTQTIDRVCTLLSSLHTESLVVAVVEANYGSPGSVKCHRRLMDFIVDRYNPYYLVLTTTTALALKDAQDWYDEKTFKSLDDKPKLILVNTSLSGCFKQEHEVIPNVSQIKLLDDHGKGSARRASFY